MLSIYCNSRIKSSENWKKTERATKIKPFISKYNWKGTNFSSGKDKWKKVDKSNPTSVLNVLYIKK